MFAVERPQSFNLSLEEWDSLCDKTLQDRFGYESLREYQRSVFHAFYKRENVMQIIGTGQGKSLCFQLPAVALGKCCLVISPLISLMEDQVSDCLKKGIKAVYVRNHSYLNDKFMEDIYEGRISVIHMSPELAYTEVARTFVDKLMSRNSLCLLAIDEAHCVSEWGRSFRGEYSELRQIVSKCKNIPLICLTATATNDCVTDICELLECPSMHVMRYNIDRQNLIIHVKEREHGNNEELFKLIQPNMDIFRKGAEDADNSLLQRSLRGFTLIYCATRASTDDLVKYIQNQTFSSNIHVNYANTKSALKDLYPYYLPDTSRTYEPNGSYKLRVYGYHAGMDEHQRAKTLQDCQNNTVDILVCTTAFGMGINIPNIRQVIHHGQPLSLESYVQQIGRGGRDGQMCVCTMLYSQRDFSTQKQILTGGSGSVPVEEVAKSLKLAKMMQMYVHNVKECRQLVLRKYFHDLSDSICGKCDVCTGLVLVPDEKTMLQEDITIPTWLLSNVIMQTGQRYGIVKIIEIITGKQPDFALQCVGFYDSARSSGLSRSFDFRSCYKEQELQDYLCEKIASAGTRKWMSVGVTTKGLAWLKQAQQVFKQYQPPSMLNMHFEDQHSQLPFSSLVQPQDIRVWRDSISEEAKYKHLIPITGGMRLSEKDQLIQTFIQCEHVYKMQHKHSSGDVELAATSFAELANQHIDCVIPGDLKERQLLWEQIRQEYLDCEISLKRKSSSVDNNSVKIEPGTLVSLPNTRDNRLLKELLDFTNQGKSIQTFITTKRVLATRIHDILMQIVDMSSYNANNPVVYIVQANIPDKKDLDLLTKYTTKQELESVLSKELTSLKILEMWDIAQIYKTFLNKR